MDYAEISIDHKFHRHLIGKSGANSELDAYSSVCVCVFYVLSRLVSTLELRWLNVTIWLW